MTFFGSIGGVASKVWQGTTLKGRTEVNPALNAETTVMPNTSADAADSFASQQGGSENPGGIGSAGKAKAGAKTPWLSKNFSEGKVYKFADRKLTEMAEAGAKRAFIGEQVKEAVTALGEGASKEAIREATRTATQRAAAEFATVSSEAVAKAAASSTANTVATKASGVLGKLGGLSNATVWGGAVAAAFEVPDVIEGFKEGRGAAQIGKSASVVGGAIGGMALGTAIGTAICPVAGSAIGAVAGFLISGACALAGSWLGGKVGSGLFGDNKKSLFGGSDEHKVTQEEVEAALAAQQAAVAQQQPQAQQSFGSMTVPGSMPMPAGQMGGFDPNNYMAGLPKFYA